MSDTTVISGEKRPLVGLPHRYHLNIRYSSVRWEVRDVNKVLMSNTTGVFTFTNNALGKEFTIYAYCKENEKQLFSYTHQMVVKPLSGPPSVIQVFWLNTNFQPIGKETVKYLDDIYLSIQTTNIPPGDYLEVKIWEKEKIGEDRSPGTLYGEVNEKGIALIKVSAELLKNYAEKLNGLDWFNDSVHQYYAEITYYGVALPDERQVFIHSPGNPPPKVLPKMKITAKSEVLNIENMAEKTVPLQNGQKPVVVLADKIPSVELKPVKLKINVYFDGTMNNKYNVELYNNPDEMYGVGDIKILGHIIKFFYGRGDESTSSYKQGYTSIADLYELDQANPKKKEIKVYIEGVGSIPYGEDEVVWGAGAAWIYGIKAKASKALSKILENAKSEKVVNVRKEYVNEDEVCVFGFSRGATTARFFTSKRGDIALNTQGESLLKPKVIFKFVGLFDTVSSVAGLGDDVERYKLAMGGRVNKVLHLTAGNEFRSKFSLTDIKSSIEAGVGYELKLPGDHSDIGGGHKNGIEEKIVDFPNFVDKLIKEGWHKEEDRITKTRAVAIYGSHSSYIETYNEISRTIYNRYRYIPLEIMTDFGKEYGLVKFDKDRQKDEYSVKLKKIEKESAETKEMIGKLEEVRKRLVDFAKSNDGAHRKSAMNEIPDLLKDLRHYYLHQSSIREGGKYGIKDAISAGGRYDKNGNPNREEIPG